METPSRSMTDIDIGHTTFLLICMALVQIMTPGLAFFYGGLCRKENVNTMMGQSFASMGIVTVLWFVVGFSLCFGHSLSNEGGLGFIGNPGSYFFFNGIDGGPLLHEAIEGHGYHGVTSVFLADVPGLVFAGYQGMFAVITPALMTGCFEGRIRFAPYLVFVTLWMLVVYCPLCHMVWGPNGYMASLGVKDFAGGIVVHISSGFSALASLAVLGKRPPAEEGENDPHNVPFIALGTGLLWFGWFGFNAGSALGANSVAAYAAINSEIAASVAMTVWMFIEWYRFGKPKLVGLCVGAIAGLATVTPAAGFIQPWGAFIIGFFSAFVCYMCIELRTSLGWDDALDVWGVHGCGGFFGTVMLGALADENVNGVHRGWGLLMTQLTAAVFTAVYSMGITYVMLLGMSKVVRLKPNEDEMALGLDISTHGEVAYKIDMSEFSPKAARQGASPRSASSGRLADKVAETEMEEKKPAPAVAL